MLKYGINLVNKGIKWLSRSCLTWNLFSHLFLNEFCVASGLLLQDFKKAVGECFELLVLVRCLLNFSEYRLQFLLGSFMIYSGLTT